MNRLRVSSDSSDVIVVHSYRSVEFGLTQPLCQPMLRQDADDFADPTDATEMLRR
jgi:hypothetical protein